MKKQLKNMTLEELKNFLTTNGEKAFRSTQISKWVYKQPAIATFREMNNLPKNLIETLEENMDLFTLKTEGVFKSKIDGTRKYVFSTNDGYLIESVFLKYKYGNSVCVSSQAGCRMACSFCASGLDGLQRNLTYGELMDQVLIASNDTGEKISHVVIMGTGEPFDNYENVKKFIEITSDSDKLGLSRRNITVSTCGVIPGIEQMSEDLPQVNLAISLHGSNDQVRNSLIPINNKYNIKDILEISKRYIAKTGRRITFEYALIHGVNDQKEHAYELGRILKGLQCHVNLIPLNYVSEIGLDSSSKDNVRMFYKVLNEAKIQTTIRRELGSDIDAACGQLRLDIKNSEQSTN